jgi:cation diffusion facilitator family transporter
MSTEGGTKAIIAALSANLGIAATKFIAFLLSGASSMLAESVHSLADSTNQVLLLIGQRRGRKKADADHPFGYGRTRYVYAFIVSIILFSVGGVFALYEGYEKVTNPHPLDAFWWWLPFVVLVVSIGLESFSLSTAVREARRHKQGESWVAYVRHAKTPELPVVLLEDVAALIGLVFALIGVGLTQLTGNGVWDGIATLAIGVLLVAVAIVLGIEMSSLLIGEGATAKDDAAIRAAVEGHPGVERIIHLKTLYLGPDELMVGAKLALSPRATLRDIAEVIDGAEEAVREAVPAARVIYFEPDVDRAAAAEPKPPTDAIVIKSTD